MAAASGADIGSIKTLAVIGGGRMGEAIIGGLLASGVLTTRALLVAEPDADRRDALHQRYGVNCVAVALEAVKDADVVLFAVKPQVLDAVVASVSAEITDTLVISIAAGVSCARIETLLPAGTPVVRVMPNTPALVGAGMALVSAGTEASDDHVELVAALFAAIGDSVIIDEHHQHAGTAISGSGPAYFALVVDALARAGVAEGLSPDIAQRLAVRTMLGTAELIERTGTHPAQIIEGVSSPGGTTVAALERLEAGGVRDAFAQAVKAAVRRSKELGA